MPKKPPDLFSFWNELKRRKVVKTVLVYVAVAWAILEAADTIFPRLGLPEWTVTFVLILLIIIFILVIVLTWVYDITPEGIKVTKDIECDTEQETIKKQSKGKNIPQNKTITTSIKENELQQKVTDLETQLREAKTLSVGKALPLLLKKLMVPLTIIILLVLLVLFKQKITDRLGLGSRKREVAMEHNFNATMLIKVGDIESARLEVERALESDPEYSYAWSNKGVISYLQGDLDKAINEITKSISLDSRNSKGPYNLAYALDDQNDYMQAVRWYKEAIRIDSIHNVDSVLTAASSALGRLYNSSGQTIAAIIVLERAKMRFPHSENISYIYKNLGNAYLLRNQTDSALKYLELSVSINPGETETNLFLAKAYEAAGDINKSISQWQKYIEQETDTSKIRDAAKRMKELAMKQLQEIIKK